MATATLYTKSGTDSAIATAVSTSGGASGGSGGGASPTVSLLTPATTAALNTTNINSALSTLASAGGGQLVLGAGVWHHNGIIFPAGGYVELRGVSAEGTDLYNDSTTAASVTVAGAGGANARPYASGWALRDITVTTASVRANQIGLKLSLASMFEVSNVQVTRHDTAFQFDSCWEFLFRHNAALNFGAYGYRFIFNSANAGSTPSTFIDCHAITGTGSALYIQDAVNGLTWIGGDILGTTKAFQILGSQTRTISISGTNFEGNTGADITIGNSTGTATYPGAVTITNTRHHHGGSTGNANSQPIAIDHQTGGPVNVIGSYFSGYTTAINQSNVAGVLLWQGLQPDAVTNTVLAVPSSVSKNFTSTAGVVSPLGYTSSDSSAGLSSSAGIAPSGDAKIYAFNNLTPWAALGNIGDFYLQGGGVAGSRIYMKTAATVWTPVDNTGGGGGGGMANPMTGVGDLITGGASGAPQRVVGNTASTKRFLASTGTGSAATAPVWSAVTVTDIAGANLLQTSVAGINTQTGTQYTLVLSDAGKVVEMSNSSANTLVIPANGAVAYPIGTTIRIAQTGAGVTVFSPNAGVTIKADGALTSKGQYAVATLIKRATDEWLLSGVGTPTTGTGTSTGGTGTGTGGSTGGGNGNTSGGGTTTPVSTSNLIAVPTIQNASAATAFLGEDATVALDSVVNKTGGTSIKVTPAGVGAYPYVTGALYSQWAPVTAGTRYTGFASVRMNTGTAINFDAYLVWYDSAGNQLGLGANGTAVAMAQNTWVQVVTSDVAPASAAYAVLLLEGLASIAATDTFNVDEVGIVAGTGTTWNSSTTTQPGQATPSSVTDTGFAFTGSWTAVTSTPTEHYSSTTGDTAVASFTANSGGSTISLRGQRDSSNGTVNVSIDGNTPVSVSQSGTSTPDTTLWTSGLLAAGDHTLTVTVTSPDGSVTGANLSNGTFKNVTSGGTNTGGGTGGGGTTPPATGANPSGVAPPAANAYPGYTQVLVEDFNTAAALGQFGNKYPGWNGYDGNVSDNSGTHWDSKSTMSVHDGMLEMHHQYNTTPTAGALTPIVPSVGGSWFSQGQLYGKWIVRFYAESTRGFKIAWLLWPTDPGTWYDGEIDFPEGPLNGNITSAAHDVQGTPEDDDYHDFGVKMAGTGWHTAMIEWESGFVRTTLDGVSYTTTNARFIPKKKMRWDLQNEVDVVAPTTSSAASVYIDWLAQYTKN